MNDSSPCFYTFSSLLCHVATTRVITTEARHRRRVPPDSDRDREGSHGSDPRYEKDDGQDNGAGQHNSPLWLERWDLCRRCHGATGDDEEDRGRARHQVLSDADLYQGQTQDKLRIISDSSILISQIKRTRVLTKIWYNRLYKQHCCIFPHFLPIKWGI